MRGGVAAGAPSKRSRSLRLMRAAAPAPSEWPVMTSRYLEKARKKHPELLSSSPPVDRQGLVALFFPLSLTLLLTLTLILHPPPPPPPPRLAPSSAP